MVFVQPMRRSMPNKCPYSRIADQNFEAVSGRRVLIYHISDIFADFYKKSHLFLLLHYRYRLNFLLVERTIVIISLCAYDPVSSFHAFRYLAEGCIIAVEKYRIGMADKELAAQLNAKCDKMLEDYTAKADQIFDSVLGRLK